VGWPILPGRVGPSVRGIGPAVRRGELGRGVAGRKGRLGWFGLKLGLGGFGFRLGWIRPGFGPG
jgi:hypothetical protein